MSDLFRALIGAATVLACATVADAQAWRFDDGASPRGKAATAPTESIEIGFYCTRAGVDPAGHPPHDSDNYELRIRARDIATALGTTLGDVDQLELGIDGSPLGRGPFLNTGDEGFASMLPRGHSFVSALTSGRELSIRAPAADVTIRVSLAGFGDALAALAAFCDATDDAATTAAAKGPSFDCAAAGTPTEHAICGDPELALLDARLADVFTTRRVALSGPAAEAFVADQQAWLRLRDTCADDADCLSQAMRARVRTLDPAQQAVAGAVAETPAEPAAPNSGLRPLSAAELADVLIDPQAITRRFTIAAVRARPTLLDHEPLLRTWYRSEVAQGRQPQTPAELAMARDHLSRTIEATPQGPFLISQARANPFGNPEIRSEGLVATGRENDPNFSASLGIVDLSVPILGQVQVRARSRYDVSFLPATAAQAQAIADEQNLQLHIAIEVSDVEVIGTPQSYLSIIAAGEVRYAGLYRRPQEQGVHPGAPQLLAASFPPIAAGTSEPGLATVADRLGVRLHEGAVLDGSAAPRSTRGSGALHQLVRLMGVRSGAAEELSEALRAFAFHELATTIERDDTIPPVYFDSYGNSRGGLRFAQHVDEFERAELLARLDETLWPRLLALVPEPPIEGIALAWANLGEYDLDRGGFLIRANLRDMGLAAVGEYPALRSLPELLPMSVENARQLIDYLEAVSGPGARRAVFAVRYRLTDVGAAEWDENRLPQIMVEPLSLSLHAWTTLEPGDDPFAQRIADFELDVHRGPSRPVPSSDRVAFWNEVDGWTRATTDDIARAALSVADDASLLDRIADGTTQVAQANGFDRDAVRARAKADLVADGALQEIVLDGYLATGQYDPASGSLPVEEFRLEPERGPLGAPNLRIAFVDPTVLQRLEVEAAEAERLVSSEDRHGSGGLGVTARLKPVLAVREGNRDVLYVEPVRIVVRAASEDGTGYPATYIEIAPDPMDAAPAEATDPAEVAPPAAVPLDGEYLDLRLVRETGDAVRPVTFERMMHDRRVREAVLAALGQEPPWGRFFDDPTAPMNAVQQREALARFTDWTRARAEVLPEEVYVTTTAGGMIPTELHCTLVSAPPQSDFERYLPAGMAAHLSGLDYQALVLRRQPFERSRGEAPYRLPYTHFAIYGRPSLGPGGVARTDSNQSTCGRIAGALRQQHLGAARRWDALVTVEGAFRAPVPRDVPILLRDYGTVAVGEPTEDGFVDVTLEVSRTEFVEVSNREGDGFAYESVRTLDVEALADALLAPPLTTDIFGIAPGKDWEAARAAAVARLPEALVAELDGPPQSFREVVSNTLLGPEVQFQAYRNGHVFFDPARREVLALLREATRDPDRVLAVGSYRKFDAGSVTQESLIGALLRKYGEAPRTEDNPSLSGPRPGQILVWGERAGCLPGMRGSVNDDGIPRDDDAAYRSAYDLSRAFSAPQLSYQGSAGLLFESCPPTVWASVGEDRERILHLRIWSLDLALLHEVAQLADLTTRADGDRGSRELIDQAADIDL